MYLGTLNLISMNIFSMIMNSYFCRVVYLLFLVQRPMSHILWNLSSCFHAAKTDYILIEIREWSLITGRGRAGGR